MNDSEKSLLTEAETLLKARFSGERKAVSKIQSTALESHASERIDQLALPESARGPMPLTKDKFMVRENPNEVRWEREVRKFLVRLTPSHGHRVSAVMIYEWVTGINVADLMAAGGSTVDLKRINRVLTFYFGKPYMTYICGRKVARAYRVKPGYYITKHRPMTLTLYAEYLEGTLGHRENP